jgi:hypothetical protein
LYRKLIYILKEHLTSLIIVQVRYSTFQTKELSIIEYGKLLFPHSYKGKGLDAFGVSAFTCVLVRKKKPPRSNKGQFFCLKWRRFQQYFSNIEVVSIIGGGNWRTQRKPRVSDII